jgi:hypothetical protein
MTELLLKILVILVIGFILYLSFSTSKVKEGLTGLTSSNSSSSSSSSSSLNGVAGNINSYATQIVSQITKLQDAFVFPTYTNDYQQFLVSNTSSINTYIQLLALNTLLNISEKEIQNSDITPSLEKFNTYMTASANINTLYNSMFK